MKRDLTQTLVRRVLMIRRTKCISQRFVVGQYYKRPTFYHVAKVLHRFIDFQQFPVICAVISLGVIQFLRKVR